MAVEFKQTTLDNGLTIIGEVNPDAHTGAVGFFVNTGVRDETDEIMGVSHFLEHMVFKGTDRRSPEDVNREFDEIGANYNAATGHEITMYYAHVLPEYMPRAIDLLSDILRPAIRSEDFDMEKNVILEEIGMYEDRPFWVALEHTMEQYFARHPMGYRILGTQETIEQLDFEQMKQYFARQYSPGNIVVAMTGQIDFDRCVEQIGEACGAWEQRRVERRHDDWPLESRDKTFEDPKLARHYMVMMAPAPAAQDDRRYASAVLANVLGDSEGSRLYWRLVDPGLADEADLHHQPFDRAGAYLGFASCAPDKADEVEQAYLDVIDRAGEDLDDEEVERSRNKIALGLTLQDERPMGRMVALGRTWLYLGEYRPLSEEMDRLMAVTPDDLRDLLEAYPFQPRTTVRLRPAGGE